MKKLNNILNIIMGSFFGVFIGRSLYVIWKHNTNPEFYTMQSAPWYTSILVYGLFTMIIFAIYIAIKIALKFFAGKNSDSIQTAKVDKGFELFYFNLSHRRKFIRTLWMIPWMIIVLVFLYWKRVSMFILIPVTLLFAITEYIQAAYNYKKWKEETNKEKE